MYRADGPEETRPVGETEFVNGVAAMSASGGTGRRASRRHRRVCRPPARRRVGRCSKRTCGQPALPRHPARAAWDATIASGNQTPTRHGSLPRLASARASPAPRAASRSMPGSTTRRSRADRPRAGFPATPIVFNHLGGPIGSVPTPDGDEVFASWGAIGRARQLPERRRQGGRPRHAIYGLGFTASRAGELNRNRRRRRHRWCIEVFGADRCMFESNFPVDGSQWTTPTLWGAFDMITTDLSAGERAALFHDTAARVYRLRPREGAART